MTYHPGGSSYEEATRPRPVTLPARLIAAVLPTLPFHPSDAMTRRPALLLSLVLALFVSAACTNEIDESTRPSNLAGTYTLSSYDGRALPALVGSDRAGDYVVTAGSFVLRADHRWSEEYNVVHRLGTQQNIETTLGAGSWSQVRESSYMLFNDRENAYQFSGTASGRTLTLNNVAGARLVYLRD
jgi:hypothetical protein